MKNSYFKSRREFLRNTGLSALGLWTIPAIPSMVVGCNEKRLPNEASKTFSGIRTRRNIADIPVNDPEIRLLKDAVGILKERSLKSPLDPSGWDALGLLHTKFCATSIYSNQMHYNWFVWPWHRAYIWSLEEKLRKAVGEPQLVFHYWDWTKKNYIPEHFFGGATNPLWNKTREVGPEDEIPKDLINVGATFRANHYKTFGGYPSIKKFGDPQLDGMAEQTFHNSIHNWIGGQMATFAESGFDPIFYAHHGNCDRIWDAWRYYSTQNNFPEDEEWLEKRMFVTDGDGAPTDFKIKDLLDTRNLGYQFENLDFNTAFVNPLEERDKPERAPSPRDTIGHINYRTSKADKIYRDLSKKERTHVVLHFSRVQIPYHAYCGRVYFNYELEGVKRSKYQGTFTILPIQDLDSLLLTQGVHLQLEVEKELSEVIAQGKEIEVVLQPVPLPNRNIPEEPLVLENISLIPNYDHA